jgi:hypothetical protein
MTPQLLEHCTAGAFDGTVPFPETLRRITADGVQWYSANLIFGMKTYYGAGSRHYQTPWPNWAGVSIAEHFDADAVSAAIRASQAGAIDYTTFLRRIADAGVVYYTVHILGRKAVYFGRHGDSFTEPFPVV